MKLGMELRRRSACILLLLNLIGACQAAQKPRVRQELRKLTDDQYRALIMGLSTMLTVSTSVGRQLWGPRYISYQELIVKHAVATNDPRGDQGHNGPPFMTFHRAFLLELELSLLAVAGPTLTALPYWDITLDNPGTGKYYGTPNALFSDKYAGRNDGDLQAGWGVTSGVFAWRQVGRFIPAQWPQYTRVYNGSLLGFVRGPTNTNGSPLVTRFPTQNLVDAIKKASKPGGTSSLPFANLTAVAIEADWLLSDQGNLVLRYPDANYQRCLDPTKYKTWMEWNFCVDITVLQNAPSTVDRSLYVGPAAGTTALLHAAPHWTTGGLGLVRESLGDMFDVSTSPNEALLFFLHHANLDRSAMTWQHAGPGRQTAVSNPPNLCACNPTCRHAWHVQLPSRTPPWSASTGSIRAPRPSIPLPPMARCSTTSATPTPPSRQACLPPCPPTPKATHTVRFCTTPAQAQLRISTTRCCREVMHRQRACCRCWRDATHLQPAPSHAAERERPQLLTLRVASCANLSGPSEAAEQGKRCSRGCGMRSCSEAGKQG